MKMTFWQVYCLWYALAGHFASAIDVWTPVSLNRALALSVTRGRQVDLRPAIAFTNQAKAGCTVQFIARDHCGRVEPSRFSCSGHRGPILYQHFGCLSARELATFLVSSPTENAANVSTFSLEIIIEATQPPTSEITVEQIERDLSSSLLIQDEGTYNYRVVFPTALIGRCHYEVVTKWPHLSLPTSGSLIGDCNQPIPCGLSPDRGFTYVPHDNSSLVIEDYLLIKVHSNADNYYANQYVILPISFEPAENSSAVHVFPMQHLVVRQGANTPVPSSLLTFTDFSHSLQLNDSRYIYHYTFPVLRAGAFRSTLSSSTNVLHTTFTNLELLDGDVAFYPSFSAPLLMIFQCNISNTAGVVVATSEISVFVQGHEWEWPVQRTNRPIEVMEGGSSFFDQTVFDFYLQSYVCMLHAAMMVIVPPKHGHMTYLNGSALENGKVLIGALKNGTVLMYNQTSSSPKLTDSIVWEISCPSGFLLQVFTSILIAPHRDFPTELSGGLEMTVYRSWAIPLSPSIINAYDIDSPLDEVVVTLSPQEELVKISNGDMLKSNDYASSYLSPFVSAENLLSQNITEEVSNFTLADLEAYSIWYVPPADVSETNQTLSFSIDDSAATVQVNLLDTNCNQSLFFSTQEEYPSLSNNLPLPLHTNMGTYITSSYLYSQALPYPPDKVVYMVRSPPTNGLLCLVSGERCHTSISHFTQRDVNSQRVLYKQIKVATATAQAESIKEDSFGFELTLEGFHQQTTALHRFHFKPVQTPPVSVAMDRTFYVNAEGSKPIAPRHFRPFPRYLDSRELTFRVVRRPHYGWLLLNGVRDPSDFTFQDLLSRNVAYEHDPAASEACSDKFSFSVRNSTHTVEGTMYVAIRRGKKDIHVQVTVGQHTLFPGQKKFVFGSEDINVSSSFCLDHVTFTLVSHPAMGVISLVDNKYNTIIQLEENSTFTANDIYSGFLHYTFTDQAPVRNQTSDGFILAAADPTSEWPPEGADRLEDGQTEGHFSVIVIPLPNFRHVLAINTTMSPGFLSWLPSYGRYGYVFSESDITIFNSTIEPHEVVMQIAEEPQFGSIWKDNSMDNIFTVEDIYNGLVWYRSDVRLDGFSSDTFQMSIIVNLMEFTRIVKKEEFSVEWATVQLQNSTLRVSESSRQVEIIVRRSGALWFESQVLLSTVAESAVTSLDCRPPADFCNMTQTLVFGVDDTEKTVIVPIDDDDIAEDTETFTVALSDPVNAVIDETRNRTKIWISDTDDYSVIRMVGGGVTGNSECSHVTRVEEWVGRARITLRRTGNLQQRVGVVCYTPPQSPHARATEFSDYIPRRRNWLNSTVWFEAHQVEAICEVEIINDPNAEILESFYVQLDENTRERAVLGEPGALHCVEINNERNDWPAVNFTLQELVVRESETSDVFVPIVINRTGPDLSVETPNVKLLWLLESGEDEAEFRKDFDLPTNESCTSGNSGLSCVTFAPGQTSAVLHVVIKHDRILETNESFHLVLNSGFRVDPYGMKVTILESAPPAVIGFARPVTRVNEMAGYTPHIESIPIVRSGYLNSSVAVYCRAKDNGNATLFSDFITTQAPSRVVFSSGDTEKACSLLVVDDDVWEGPETLRVELSLGQDDPNESLGAEISEESSSTLVVIDDPEDTPTIGFQEALYEATEPLSNFEIDRMITTLTLTRSGDLSYTTAVRYVIHPDTLLFQHPSDPTQEVVFHPQETVKELRIVLRANHDSSEDYEVIIVRLVEGRALDNASVPIRIGQLNRTVITIHNRDYRGPFFPELPVVANDGVPVSAIDLGDMRRLYSDLPLVCITPCSSDYLADSERLNSTRHGCTAQNISQETALYSWEVSQDGINFTTLKHTTVLTNTHGDRLDTFYLKSGLYVRCSARAVSLSGVKGHTRTSKVVSLGGERYSCDGSGESEARLTSYSCFGGHSKDLLKLTVRVPHYGNTIPIISSRPIFEISDIKGQGGYWSSMLPRTNNLSWTDSEPLYDHLDKARCVWEFNKWLPVEDWLSYCGGQRSNHSDDDTVAKINVTINSVYIQYDHHVATHTLLASKQSATVAEISFSPTTAAFLPPPLHILTSNEENSDAYIFPVAVQQNSTVLQIYFYSMLPLGLAEKEVYSLLVADPSGTPAPATLLHADRVGNSSNQVWLLEVGTFLPSTLSVAFQLDKTPCHMDCPENDSDDDDEVLRFSLALAADTGSCKFRPMFEASVSLQHDPDVVSNHSQPFTLGEPVYVVFSLSPTLVIQTGFVFAVSDMQLCQRTTASLAHADTCSNQQRILTGVATEMNRFDVRLQHEEHTAILQFNTSRVTVAQHSSHGDGWYLDLSYGIATNSSTSPEMVVTEHATLNISLDLSVPTTTHETSSAVESSPSDSKHFLTAAIVVFVVALIVVAATLTAVGVLVWTNKMRTQLRKKVQNELEARRVSTSRKNSVALNNKRRENDGEREEQPTLRRTQSTIGFPTREKLKRVRSKSSSTTTAEIPRVSRVRTMSHYDTGAGARAVTSEEGASVQPSKLPQSCAGVTVTRACSLPNLNIFETRTSDGFFMGDPQPRKIHFQTTVSRVNTERWHLNKWAQHHIKANKQLEAARTIHDLATRRRNYGANESKQNSPLNKESHNELARYAVRSLAASATTPEPEKGPRTKL